MAENSKCHLPPPDLFFFLFLLFGVRLCLAICLSVCLFVCLSVTVCWSDNSPTFPMIFRLMTIILNFLSSHFDEHSQTCLLKTRLL